MQYIVADLEWNGGYSRKAHGYFNEIIEVGAVRLDERLRVISHFHTKIRPAVSKKLSNIVTDLTNITPQELEDGTTFAHMMRRFSAFAKGGPVALLTWSTTDLLVWMENCRFFTGRQEIPFLRYYLDCQAYVQRQMRLDGGQQLGLAKAGELLHIPEDGMALHRALDDSILTAKILQTVADPATLAAAVQAADEAFYRRVTFKTTIINNIHHPLVKRDSLRFSCPDCGREMTCDGQWKFRNRAFCAHFHCDNCQKYYQGRVQYRLKYEGAEVRRKLVEQTAPAPEEASPLQPAEN